MGDHSLAIAIELFTLAVLYVAWLERFLIRQYLHKWLFPGIAADLLSLGEELKQSHLDYARLRDQLTAARKENSILKKGTLSRTLMGDMLLQDVATQIAKNKMLLHESLRIRIQHHLDWPREA